MRRWAPVVFALAAGCHALLDIDDIEFGDGAGGGSGTPCTTADDCPGSDGQCGQRSCTNSTCAIAAEPAGTACSEGGGAVCDGQGSCVECVVDGDCGAGICQQNACVSQTCTNGSQDGDESDLDCGGSCAPCANGLHCGEPSDCASNHCTGGTCNPCADNADCADTPGTVCDAGVCVGGLPNGEPCTDAAECGSGQCVDQLCCDQACDGTCEACNLSGSAGSCQPLPAGTDPDSECGGGVCDGAASCAVCAHTWSHNYGLSVTEGRGIAVGNLGQVLLTGSFQGNIDFGGAQLSSAGAYDLYVTELDGGGSHQWSSGYGANNDQAASAVAIDSGGAIWLTGSFGGTLFFGGTGLLLGNGEDVFVAKLDPSGTPLWAADYGAANPQRGNDIAVGPQGQVVVVGEMQSTATFGGAQLSSAGGLDVFVAQLDSDGNHLWSQRFGDINDDRALSVAIDGAGNVFVAGLFRNSIDFGGGALVAAGADDAFVAAFDSNGNPLWGRSAGSSDDQSANGVAVDAAGNVLVVGTFRNQIDWGDGAHVSAGNADAYVVKLDPSGNALWSQSYGDGAAQDATDVASDIRGNVILVGEASGTTDFGGGVLTSAGNSSAFVAKLSSNGVHLCSALYGSAGNVAAAAVATSASGDIAITGTFLGDVDFGGGNLVGQPTPDAFAVQLTP